MYFAILLVICGIFQTTTCTFQNIQVISGTAFDHEFTLISVHIIACTNCNKHQYYYYYAALSYSILHITRIC